MASIKEIREGKGIKQCFVADSLGISRQTYSAYEAEPERMTIEQAMLLADALSCTLEEIFLAIKVS